MKRRRMLKPNATRSSLLARALTVLVVAGFGTRMGLDHTRSTTLALVAARAPIVHRGDYGGDLDFLRNCYTGPRSPQESNHYFDLWSPAALPALTRVNGLTNNHALFVDSHGRGEGAERGGGYVFYPNKAMLAKGQDAPLYSARDFATVLGPAKVAQIHNLVLAGCNTEGRLRSTELRRYFPNATNVIYMTPGELAFKPMFYQAIVLPSAEIKPLFGKPKQPSGGGEIECEIASTPGPALRPLGVYLSDLYLPGANRPFRTVRAGRERLDPVPSATTDRTAPAPPKKPAPPRNDASASGPARVKSAGQGRR